MFVAEIDGVLAGFAVILPREDGNTELEGLFVEPGRWRQGIGQKLVEHCAIVAKATGSRALHVIGNPHAKGFYDRCGFVCVGTTETRFGKGWLLEKNLAADVPLLPTITIRPAVVEDIDGIARVFLESAAHHTQLDAERYFVPPVGAILARYKEKWQRSVDVRGYATIFVAESGGEVVGFVDAHLDRSPDPMHRELTYCTVAEIAVGSFYRNKGIGEQLLGAVEEWARRQGANFISVEHHVENTRAQQFYRRQGYHAAHLIAIKRL